MALNKEPILKKCKALGISPMVMGVAKETKRDPKANVRKKEMCIRDRYCDDPLHQAWRTGVDKDIPRQAGNVKGARYPYGIR